MFRLSPNTRRGLFASGSALIIAASAVGAVGAQQTPTPSPSTPSQSAHAHPSA